jgi:hypothetical protein
MTFLLGIVMLLVDYVLGGVTCSYAFTIYPTCEADGFGHRDHTGTIYTFITTTMNTVYNSNDHIKEIERLIKICDVIAIRHFTDHLPGQYPYVNRYGDPVAIVDTEKYTKAKYRVYGKQGKVGRPTAERVREVYAKPIELALDIFASHIEPMALAMVDAALGAKVLRTDENGNVIEVYTRPPDAKAADMVFNRLMGKPSEDRTVHADVKQSGGVHVYLPDNGRNTLPPPDKIIEAKFEAVDPTEYEPLPNRYVSYGVIDELG